MKYPGSPVGAGRGTKAHISAIQTQLNKTGCGPVEVDGEWGPESENAVRLFQARGRDIDDDPLDIDGVVGPMTWAALFRRAIVVLQPANGLVSTMLSAAIAQIGVREQPLGSNRGPEVNEYLRAAGLDATKGHYAWCAAFVFWCFREGAKRLSSDGTSTKNPAPKTAGVHAMWREAGEKRLLRMSPRQIVQRPELVKPGMVFFLDTGGGYGHCGIVERVSGVVLTTIEGNSNDGGSREGIGVFRLTKRRIDRINLGVADFTQTV